MSNTTNTTTSLFTTTTLLSDPPTSGLFNQWTLLRTFLLAVFLYVAKDYPSWRKRDVSSQHTAVLDKPTVTTDPTTTGPTTSSSSQPSEKSFEPRELSFFLFLPFVFLYLAVRTAWDLFRLGVFTFLQATEWTGVALGRLAVHMITEWLPRAIQAIGVWWNERFLPKMEPLVKKFKEYGLSALVRWCEEAFRWIGYFYWRVRDYTILTKAKLFQFWTDIGRPLSERGLTWAKFWLLDPLVWIVTRGIYLSQILYDTRLAIALWKDAITLWKTLAGIVAKAWDTVLIPSAIYIADKIVQAWTLATVTTPHLARFIRDNVLLPVVKHAWGTLTGPTVRKLLITVYSYLVSEATQQFLIGFCKRLTASAMFWAQKNIRAFIFFVEWAQSVTNKIIATWHWTHQHIFLPLSHFLPDLYERLSTDFSNIYTRCSSAVLSATTFIINVLWPIIAPLVRLCDFIYTHFVYPAIIFLYDSTVLIITGVLTHAHPFLSRLLATSAAFYTWISTVSYPLFANYVHPAYTVVQTRAAVVAALVAENAGPALSRATDAAAKAYERLAPRMVEIRENIAREADLLVVWVGDNLMEWVKRETEDIGDATNGTGVKAKVE